MIAPRIYVCNPVQTVLFVKHKFFEIFPYFTVQARFNPLNSLAKAEVEVCFQLD